MIIIMQFDRTDLERKPTIKQANISLMNIIVGRKKERRSTTKSACCIDRTKSLQKGLFKSGGLTANHESRQALINISDKLVPEAVERKDWHEAMKMLHKVQASLQSEGGQITKKELHTYLAGICNNKAFVSNELENDEEAASLMRKCLHHLQICSKETYSKSQLVAYQTMSVKMGLKYCAILSHSQLHDQAISQAETLLTKITQCLLNLAQLCQNSSEDCVETPQTMATSEESRERRERVDYKRIVIKEGEKLLKNMEELPSAKDLMGRLREYFQQKMNNMYFWKDNKDNNFKNISKELFKNTKNNRQRNLLGLQKSSTFVDDFSLSEAMSLDLVKLASPINCDFYYLLSAPKIIELLLLASVCYFMMATQRRFREGTLDLTRMKITEKYTQLGKDSALVESKILHLKAIQLAGQHLSPTNDFLLHLINSFNKNYKSILDEIKQQSQILGKSRQLGGKKKCEKGPLGLSDKKHQRKEVERDDYRQIQQNKPSKRKGRCTSALKRVNSESNLV